MNLTKFPFETDEPVVDVVLPTGSHTLKLVIVDDAGVQSPPDSVVVTIQPAPIPIIESVKPQDFLKGTSVDAVIFGENLVDVVDIKLYRDAQEEDRVNIVIREGGTDDQLPITVTVMEHALTGERTLAVLSESGTGTATVTVLSTEGTKIRALTPQSGQAGRGQPIAVRISGDNLEDVTDINFLYDGQPDNHISAMVRAAEADYVDSDVSISVNAAFGRRTLSVATTSEEAQSPPGVSFTVLPGVIALGIMLLTLITAVIHITLNFPDTLFILNGLGYIGLLAALYTPVPPLILGWRPTIRWVLLAYTLLTIVIWIAIGDRGTLAYATKLVEALLVLLLFVESRKA